MMVMVGAAAIAIVVVLVIMMRGTGAGAEDGDAPADARPAVSEGSTPLVAQPASTGGSAKAGKTPSRPAPALSHETLDQLDEILGRAKTHYNAGVMARNAGNNREARAEQAKAKAALDEWENLVSEQLRWQEEAEMEDWAQPAEYDILTRKYPSFSKLQKSVRMGGGK